jgi:hypothetical protein
MHCPRLQRQLGGKNIILANSLIEKSSSYDIIWDGPYKGGRLIVTFNSDKANPTLDSLSTSTADYVFYQKNNY